MWERDEWRAAMTDAELMAEEPLARIRAWDAKNGYSRAADEWIALHRECIARHLPVSTAWPDFWPTSPRAKAMRFAHGIAARDDQE